jgi:hypothetical protein
MDIPQQSPLNRGTPENSAGKSNMIHDVDIDIDDYDNYDLNATFVEKNDVNVDDDYHYDVYETFVNNSDDIEGVTPGHNVTNILSYVDRTLDSTVTKLDIKSEMLSFLLSPYGNTTSETLSTGYRIIVKMTTINNNDFVCFISNVFNTWNQAHTLVYLRQVFDPGIMFI